MCDGTTARPEPYAEWIDALRALPYETRSILTHERRFALHCMISSIGHSRVQSVFYNWSGLARGEREFGVFQLTLAGEGRLRWNGVTHVLLPGDAFLVRIPSDHHYFLPAGSESWDFLYLIIYGMEIMRVLRRIESVHGPVLRVAPHSSLPSFLLDLFGFLSEETDPTAPTVSSYAYRLVMQLLDETRTPQEGREEPAIRKAREYARSNLDSVIGVREMADAAGLSRSHFSRVFHRAEGMAPREYIEHLRLKNAMSLLSQRELMVKEVAASSGFRDENYFTRVFKRATGLTPSEYRRIGI